MSVLVKCSVCQDLFWIADIDHKEDMMCHRCETYKTLGWRRTSYATPQHPPVPEPEPDIDVSIMRPDDNTQPDIESVDCDALGHVWMWNIEACQIYCSRCGQLETA